MNPSQSEPRGLPRLYVSRPRLLRRLSDAVRCKLAVICADAGYGKTTLAADFVATAGMATEWYHLTPADRDIARLADGLGACLKHLSSGAKRRYSRREGGGNRATLGLAFFTEELLRQAAHVGPNTALLVLDDYQHVGQDTDVNSLLGSLIKDSPPSLRFIVLTRSALRLPLARLRARQELSMLGEDDLAFTLEETSLFLRRESDLDLDDAALALVQERTEGWAAGIAMVSHSLRYSRQEKVMKVLADPAASAWLVYDYLAEEVFDRQEPAIQDFLVKTSILGSLTAQACDHLLGTSGSLAVLLTLEEKGLFTTSVGPSKQSFRYHQLFRETLRQKLRERENRDSVCELHLRAARFYEQRSDWEECVHHYLEAGAASKAAEVIETVGDMYIFSGFFQTVDSWLRALPEEITPTRPRLMVLRASLSHLGMRHLEAVHELEMALRLFQVGGDETGQVRAGGDMGYVRYRTGHLQQAMRLFDSALAMAGDRSILKSEILVMQAQVLREMGRLEKSEEACRASMAALAAAGRSAQQLRGHSRAVRNLAVTKMEMGDLVAADQTVRESLAFCTAHEIGDYEETWARAQMGAILWAQGKFGEAIQSLQRALSMSGRFIAFQQHVIGLWLGNSLRDSGLYEEAEGAYEHSLSIGELERVFLLTVTGRCHDASAGVADLYRQWRTVESLIFRSTAEVVMAAVLREGGDSAKALEHIREAVRLFRAHGFRFRLASALLHQARIENDLFRRSEGRESLAESLEIVASSGYYHFFWWDPELIASSCQRALAEGIHPYYASELVTRRFGSRSSGVLAPLLQDRRSEVRRRARAAIASLPNRGPISLQDEVLADCADLRLRDSLAQAIAAELISLDGIQILRKRRSLSWREIEILIEYYLRPVATGPETASAQIRSECAQRLSISENTVRCHVNNLRGKLMLPAWVSGARVLNWAREEGLLPT